MIERLLRFALVGVTLAILLIAGWVIQQGANPDRDDWSGPAEANSPEARSDLEKALAGHSELNGDSTSHSLDHPSAPPTEPRPFVMETESPQRIAVRPGQVLVPSNGPESEKQVRQPTRQMRPVAKAPGSTSDSSVHKSVGGGNAVESAIAPNAPATRRPTATDNTYRDTGDWEEGTDEGTEEPFEPWGEILEPIQLIPGIQLASSVTELLQARGWAVQGSAHPRLTILHALEVVPHEGMPWILEYKFESRVHAPVIYPDLDVQWEQTPYEITKIPIDTRFTWLDPEEPAAIPYHIDTEYYFHPDRISQPYRPQGSYILAVANWPFNTGVTIDERERQLGLRSYEWQAEYWKRHPGVEKPPVLLGFRIVIGPAIKDYPLTLRIHRLDVSW